MAKGEEFYAKGTLSQIVREMREEADRMIYGIQPVQCRMFFIPDHVLYNLPAQPDKPWNQEFAERFPYPIFVFTTRDQTKRGYCLYLDPRRLHTFPGGPRGEGGELGKA